jgi:hypothetical protein
MSQKITLFIITAVRNSNPTNVFIIINSKHVSAQIGHHQVILEEYRNGE